MRFYLDDAGHPISAPDPRTTQQLCQIAPGHAKTAVHLYEQAMTIGRRVAEKLKKASRRERRLVTARIPSHEKISFRVDELLHEDFKGGVVKNWGHTMDMALNAMMHAFLVTHGPKLGGVPRRALIGNLRTVAARAKAGAMRANRLSRKVAAP